ncbi:MAG TPA: M23 family metallopeptidase [Bacteroidales bacterium]|nr:M23 family metallopeptidase [Bacteroidales bacterium]
MLPLKYFVITLLFFSNLDHTPKDKTIFRPPVNIPVLLSSNFGELRADHFHSGIDIKTQGKTGQEVVSSADGYIYRISISPTGFGKALYVRHPSGYCTVYGHLENFTDKVEAYVKEKQYERKSFTITLFPPKELFPVKKGELIALSGNSGSSGGPHLHYEIREADNEFPVNPLLFQIGASDNIPPVITGLAVYPIGNSFVNNGRNTLKISLTGSNGKYNLPADKHLEISGDAGFGLRIHDLLDGSTNKCAAYSIQLRIDSILVFNYEMDGFSFDESRYVNSHMDYESYIRDNVTYQRTYVLPNDKLSTYKNLLNRGIFRFNDNKIHRVQFIVRDLSNNKSVLSFNVQAVSPAAGTKPVKKEGKVMPYSRSNRFVDEDISINIPAGALYDTLYFNYKKSPATPVMLSDLHSIHNNLTPLQKAISLSIKPKIIPAGKENNMLIVRLNKNMSKVPVSSAWNEGFLKADISVFGDYFVGIDTILPSISAPGMTQGIDLTSRKELRLKIKDDFSGIRSYEAEIDGKWALFEYDPKNELLIYSFDDKYLAKGSQHNLSLKVTDNANNSNQYSLSFSW